IMRSLILGCCLLLFFRTISISADEIPAQIDQDLEQVFQDSLQTDSLQFEYPSQDTTVSQDTLAFDRKALNSSLNKLIETRSEQDDRHYLPFLNYHENYHLMAPFAPMLYFRKNGFTEQPFLINNIHYLQNHQLLYEWTEANGKISFSIPEYDLIPSFTESYLGLGDNEMNHVGVIFRKGNVLGLKDFQVIAGYLGQEGNWLGINEKSRNFNLKMQYRKKYNTIKINYSYLDQDISTLKLNYPQALTEQSYLKEKSWDSSLLWENNWFDLGLKLSDNTISSEKNTSTGMLFAKRIKHPLHQLRFALEYNRNHTHGKNNYLGTLDLNSEIKPLEFDLLAQIRSDDDYYLIFTPTLNLFSGFKLKTDIRDISLIHTLDNTSELIFPENDPSTSAVSSQRLAGGLVLKKETVDVEILTGKKINDSHEYWFLENQNNLKLFWGSVRFTLNSYLLFSKIDREEYPTLPRWQLQAEFITALLLPYNNSVKAGVITHYTSIYDVISGNGNDFQPGETTNIDLWLAIGISRKFEIRTNLINLMNNKVLFGLDNGFQESNTHFNFTVKWFFIN
ncbi:MAG: hypothetical protein JW996_03570, partial [Candidatus Cloacimonetes bacterium]|nr:hypothetical protein [Candidatus Cloacimonadota bacterium]